MLTVPTFRPLPELGLLNLPDPFLPLHFPVHVTDLDPRLTNLKLLQHYLAKNAHSIATLGTGVQQNGRKH